MKGINYWVWLCAAILWVAACDSQSNPTSSGSQSSTGGAGAGAAGGAGGTAGMGIGGAGSSGGAGGTGNTGGISGAGGAGGSGVSSGIGVGGAGGSGGAGGAGGTGNTGGTGSSGGAGSSSGSGSTGMGGDSGSGGLGGTGNAGGSGGLGGTGNTSGVGSSAGSGGAGGGAPDGGISAGTIIVGLTEWSTLNLENWQSVFMLHVVMRVNGIVTTQLDYVDPIDFPLEFPFENLPHGTDVEFEVTVTPHMGPTGLRFVKSTIVADKTLLLRVALSAHCLFELCDGGCPPPICTGEMTCDIDVCREPYISPTYLEEYYPAWPSYSYCKPQIHGPPEAILGKGESSFTPLNDADVLKLVWGPQGGHHIWIAPRMKNLKQLSVAKLTADFPDLGLTVGPLSYNRIFYTMPNVGYCEEYGVAFQLTGSDPSNLLGQTAVVTLQVQDSDGDISPPVSRTIIIDPVFP